MYKKCGCCLSDPFGAPRENCSFCDGSGLREVMEADSEVELAVNLAWGQKLKTEEYERKLQIALAEQAERKAIEEQKKHAARVFQEQQMKEAVLIEKVIQDLQFKSQIEKNRQIEEQRLIDRKYFEPSPRMGTAEYELVKKNYAGRLFKCLSCSYEANLNKNLSCGNCGRKSGYSGPE
jgi:hypothetical protein